MVEIDPMVFRKVLGHFPTGVTVVTAHDGGRPVGLAVGSFFSVSLGVMMSRETSWFRRLSEMFGRPSWIFKTLETLTPLEAKRTQARTRRRGEREGG